MPDYEVKIVLRFDLSNEDMIFIKSKIKEVADNLGMFVHEDGVTYSKRPPYRKYEDIPAGVKFYLRLKKFEKYFTLFEYYSYLEGDINGRIIRNCNKL